MWSTYYGDIQMLIGFTNLLTVIVGFCYSSLTC